MRIAGSGSLPLTRFGVDSRPVRTVSTLRLNRVIEHAAGDMTVIVQAGISLDALQRELAWRKQWLPIDPSVIGRDGRAPGQRTIGGLIASHSLGPLRFGCGDWRLFILGMRWADAAGRMIKAGGRTVKNVAGYSSHRLMIGSFGSMGAIAEVTLRTFAQPADERCVVFYCPSAAAAEELLAAIFAAPVTPAYVELIGGRTFRENPLQLPAPRAGAGDLGGELVLVAGFLGRPEVCEEQVETVRRLDAAKKMESLSQTAAQAGRLRLWMASEPAIEGTPDRFAGGAADAADSGGSAESGAGAGFRIFAQSSEAAAIVAAIENAAEQTGERAWVLSEAGNGIVRGSLTGADAQHRIAEIARRARARLLWTQGAANGAQGESIAARIKNALDPEGIFGESPE